MANLKEVRIRIASVNSTRQITSAMKMVAAAKLRKAQDAIIQMRPYSEKLTEMLSNLSGSLDPSESVYGPHKQEENILVIPITSNRGLCGAFNSQIVKATQNLIEEKYKGKNVTIMPIGRKGDEILMKFYKKPTDDLPEDANHLFDNLKYGAVSELTQKVMDAYADNRYDEVVLIYNSFKNAATQIIKTERLLPIEAEEGEGQQEELDYIFEPSKKDILQEIIPKSLKTQLFKALLDSNAAEQGARMTAMHKATDNATELLKELKLSYNKARQAAITNEILEIVSGANALNG